jgi:hypothetical protein
MKIWTEAYRPWIMGGDVNAPIWTEVLAGSPVDIGNGFQAYLITSPSGATYVAEAITGALIGTTIKQVKIDVATGDPEVMLKQIEDAKARVKRADYISPETFWRMLG